MKKSILLLCFVIIIAIAAIITQWPDNKLHIYICDVGQGDGILIQKGTNQIVVDAGPNNAIESCLGAHMPFWDRTIEVALMTHADSDHSYGFIEMVKRYRIQTFIGSFVDNDSRDFSSLKATLASARVDVLEARAGRELRMDGVVFKVVFPTSDYIAAKSSVKSSENVLGSRTGPTNDFCAVGALKYGNFSGVFACDTSPSSEKIMLANGLVGKSYFLKVPHHGSRNGLTQTFLDAIDPEIAAISVGAKNNYGHPSPEVLQMLERAGVRTLRTDKHGEIEIVTDGAHVWVKN